MGNEPKFSPQDAEAILQLVRAAPLANMSAAEQVAAIIQRYAAHTRAHFNPPPPDAVPPAV
jgi:hypothetical protein